jgi:hypothetical protein
LRVDKVRFIQPRSIFMRTIVAIAVVTLISVQTAAAQERATPDPPGRDQGVGERLGESVDRGLNNLGQRLRKTWADFRQSVDELSVQGRVYGRLHWDKSLANAPIDITMQNENTVVLAGSVPDEAARATAVALAQSTVGVGKVVDQLAVSSAAIPAVPQEPSGVPPLETSPPLATPQR